MDNPNDSERKKDEGPSQNGLHVKDEQFWQNTTTILASTIISDDLKNKDGNEIVSKLKFNFLAQLISQLYFRMDNHIRRMYFMCIANV